MRTSKSPRTVMLWAQQVAIEALPEHFSRYSRQDYTLAQLFACLVVGEMLGLSFRELEAVLRDVPDWCEAIGLKKVPDHNTLWRAHRRLLSKSAAAKLLDVIATHAEQYKLLRFDRASKPLVVDATYLEERHVSRYFEFRRGRGGGGGGRKSKLKRAPKLASGVASESHVIVSCHASSGTCSDNRPYLELLFHAWRRTPGKRLKKVVADAGYDGESFHVAARSDLGIATIVPPRIGRPSKTGALPTAYWRRHMRTLLATKESRRRCGYTQRWQAETTASMLKRNLGSACRGKSNQARQRDLLLKVLTHNLMILRRRQRGLRQSRSDPVFLGSSSRWWERRSRRSMTCCAAGSMAGRFFRIGRVVRRWRLRSFIERDVFCFFAARIRVRRLVMHD